MAIAIKSGGFKPKSQPYLVLSHLLDGKTLTQNEAFEMYGVLRLSAVVFKLKAKGYPINTTEVLERNHKGVYTKKGRYWISQNQ
jgi:hypothetical protein